MPDSRRPAASVAPIELVLALCHEVGNLVGAVRLQAHLIDEDMTRRDLARATLDVDDSCVRSAVLLAHIRPLLAGAPSTANELAPAELLASVHAALAEQGGANVVLDLEAAEEVPPVRFDREVLHHLLQSLVLAALGATRETRVVSLAAESVAAGVAFVVEDEGAEDAELSDWRSQAPRGRPLVLKVVDAIVGRFGGSVAVSRKAGRTCVAVILPAA